MMAILTIAAGRRAKWIILLFWVAVLIAAFPFASKLTSAESNEASSYLPANAESTKVLDIEKQFPSGQTAPAFVVYHRDGGLTAADRAKATADHDALAAHPLDLGLPPSPLIPSQDGKAMLFNVPFQDTPDSSRLVASVKALRALVGGGPDNLDTKVTGPAGFAADSNAVFGDINGKLLLGTVVIVTILLLITYRSPFLWLFPLIAVGLANQVTIGGRLWRREGRAYRQRLSARHPHRADLWRGHRLRAPAHRPLPRGTAAARGSRMRRWPSRSGSVMPGGRRFRGDRDDQSPLSARRRTEQQQGARPRQRDRHRADLVAMLTLLPALLVIVRAGCLLAVYPSLRLRPARGSGFWARVGRGSRGGGGWCGSAPRSCWAYDAWPHRHAHTASPSQDGFRTQAGLRGRPRN